MPANIIKLIHTQISRSVVTETHKYSSIHSDSSCMLLSYYYEIYSFPFNKGLIVIYTNIWANYGLCLLCWLFTFCLDRVVIVLYSHARDQ